MNNKRKLWIGVISFVLAFLVFVVLMMIQSSMQQEVVYEEVWCVKNTVPEKLRITEQNVSQYFEMKRVPEDVLPENYISEKNILYDQIVNTELSVGTIMTANMAAEHETYYKAYEDLTWISVPVSELYEGVAGRLRAGDYIDIYVLTKTEEAYHCELAAESVRVEAAYSEQGAVIEAGNEEGLGQLIVIPMEKAEVASFYELLAQGNIRIARYDER